MNSSKQRHHKTKNKNSSSRRSVRLSRLLEETQWHSSTCFNTAVSSGQKNKNFIANTPENRREFIVAGHHATSRFSASARVGKPGEFLIRKSDRALWRVSDDGQRIEPSFTDDIITVETEEDR